MADTGGSNQIFIEDIDPTSIIIKEYLIKLIYSSNRFKDFTIKLPKLLERIPNVSIKLIVEEMYQKIRLLIEELKEIEKAAALVIQYINKISDLFKLTQEFESILNFYSFR
jgi:hypothetical protein